MDKDFELLEHYTKLNHIFDRFVKEMITVDLAGYHERYYFACKAQHLCAAIENLLDKITVFKFESHPLLKKLQAFRDFFERSYDCELDERKLETLQKRLKEEFPCFQEDLRKFFSEYK